MPNPDLRWLAGRATLIIQTIVVRMFLGNLDIAVG
jgi:hypothetical protein